MTNNLNQNQSLSFFTLFLINLFYFINFTGVGTKISTNFFENIDKISQKYRQIF